MTIQEIKQSIVGVTEGENIVVKFYNGTTRILVFNGYDVIGIQGFDSTMLSRPLMFFAWANIMSITKDENTNDEVRKIK